MRRLDATACNASKGLPGVESVGATCCVPLEGGYGLPFIIVGRPLEGPSHRRRADGSLTSPGYFDVFKIPVMRGRLFADRDDTGRRARRHHQPDHGRQFWPKGDPLGRRSIIGKGVSRGIR